MSDLTIIAGKPFNYDIRFPGLTSIWPTFGSFQIRAQLRVTPESSSRFIANLHNWMTKTIDGADIVLQWRMNATETRALYALKWGEDQIGYFNLVISDPGSNFARAYTLPTLQLRCLDTTSSATGT